MNIIEELFKMRDEGYKKFQAKLIPNISEDDIIGVRTPQLRTFAKRLKGSEEERAFLSALPHKYYEENNLHAFLISEIKNFDRCIFELNRFLPHVDNWATCDGMRPKCFRDNKEKLLIEIEKWMMSHHTYTVRFAIEMLMTYYLDLDFDEKYLYMVSNIKSDEYYVNMMIAWYFATALAKQQESAFPYIENERLPLWVRNKTIQKAVESYRISGELKEKLKSLRGRI